MNFYRSILGSGQDGGTGAESYATIVNDNVQFGGPFDFWEYFGWKDSNLTNYYNFNDDVIVGDKFNNCFALFRSLANFNGNVTFGLNCTNFNETFATCVNFNRPVTFPARANRLAFTFYNCPKFNSNVTFLGNNIDNCAAMFLNCPSFNKAVNLPNGVLYCEGMFRRSAFNRDMYIPASVQICNAMFMETPMSKNIYFNGANIPLTYSMLENRTSSDAVRIFTSNSNINRFAYVAGSSPLTWENVASGYYNNLYNIYVYYNYSAT